MSISSKNRPFIRAVAWDMDGLMFNTEDIYFRTGCLLMERRGGVYTQELCDSIMGCTPRQAFEAMIAWNHLSDTWQELQIESEKTFLSLLDTSLAPMPGTAQLLDFLEARGIPKAVCTSSSRVLMENILQRQGWQSRFVFTLTADELQHGKPDPEIYFRAAERFGVPPSQMMVLEDSQNGCRAAASAGAFVVAVPAEHSRHMDFSMATLCVDSLADARLYENL